MTDKEKTAASELTLKTEHDELAALAARYREVLEQLQWCGDIVDAPLVGQTSMCPLCDQIREKGHSPDCPTGNALALTPPAALDEQRKREAEIRREVAQECASIAAEVSDSYSKDDGFPVLSCGGCGDCSRHNPPALRPRRGCGAEAVNIYRVLGLLCITITAITACAVSSEPNSDWTDGAVIFLVFFLGVAFDIARRATEPKP